MYARLNRVFGWVKINPDGTSGPFLLLDIERYAGMISGYTECGRKVARPLSEFEALSHDGETWQPVKTLLIHVPWEASRVRISDLPLPVPQDEDRQ